MKDMTPITLAKEVRRSNHLIIGTHSRWHDDQNFLWGFQHQTSLLAVKHACRLNKYKLASKHNHAVDTIIGIVTKIRNKKDFDSLSDPLLSIIESLTISLT